METKNEKFGPLRTPNPYFTKCVVAFFGKHATFFHKKNIDVLDYKRLKGLCE